MTFFFLLLFLAPADPGSLPPDRVWIEMKERLGLGDHELTVRIEGTGLIRVTKRMNDSGKVTELWQRKIDQKQFETMLNDILAARFFEMPEELGVKERIQLRGDGTYQELMILTTDGMCMDLTVAIGMKRKTVSECNADWKVLEELYSKIYELAEAKKWPVR